MKSKDVLSDTPNDKSAKPGGIFNKNKVGKCPTCGASMNSKEEKGEMDALS